jgi:hypothetical protein
MVTTREQADRITKARVSVNKCPTGEKFHPNYLPKAVRRYLKRNNINGYEYASELKLV